MKYYRDKTVLITGASSGIGEALALELAEQGARLILAARRMGELQRVGAACELLGAKEILCLEVDVTIKEQVQKLIQTLRDKNWTIDVLINNAGISQRALISESKEEVERQIMEVNYFAPVYLSKEIRPLFSKEAHMVIISSLSGLFGFPLRSTYAASKHALKGFFESWQVENPHPAISLVFPGRIQSNISLHALEGDGTKHAVMDKAQEEGMPAKECAQIILKGTAKKKKKIVIGRKEVILYRFYQYLPPLYYKIASTIKANG
ncbi:MAG: SDR family oxidoreductase [Bacteroidota bacterium]|nr:SDR family oxidoreductase [Bacteroidota bacterium]MDX5431076.1 SDR family oxidoreductase [Bacteroidota bacterium]MDX5469830.1 SDR family oxidoreductase [Bacteroidota bacterium]